MYTKKESTMFTKQNILTFVVNMNYSSDQPGNYPTWKRKGLNLFPVDIMGVFFCGLG